MNCLLLALSFLRKQGMIVCLLLFYVSLAAGCEAHLPTDLPGDWSYTGCITDNVPGRVLTGAAKNDKDMTNEACVAFCDAKEFAYAGTEYGVECYCGNTIAAGSNSVDDSKCSQSCGGNETQPCGGPNLLTLFNSGKPSRAGPVTNPGRDGWKYLDCYTDDVGARTLTNGVPTPGGQNKLTVELCNSACEDQNYSLSGVEYGGECYCGKEISSSGTPASDGSAGCRMPCNGNSSEFCGGPNRLNLYKLTMSSSPGSSNPPSQSTTNSEASATQSSAAQDATVTTATPTSDTKETSTNTPNTLPNSWEYRGCYVDRVDGRSFDNQQPDDRSLTVESCVRACIDLGYSVAAMEYGIQCFCDNSIHNDAPLANSDKECAMACGGAANEICGDGNRLSVYSNKTIQKFIPPGPQKVDLPGSWKYQGCIKDDQLQRTFPYQLEYPDTNSAETCLSQCAKYGYGAGGMEYGRECYCGDIADVIGSNRTLLQPESDCNMKCPGNTSYICGAGGRISYYTSDGDSVAKWEVGTGNDAGEYRFLIGGVVIPLITTPGINGKVTFVEKHGTGPPNSTGAYELDLTQVDNFTAAWRPMHVKTDVFCAAGLTLPDKVARQINVGGWSLDSTFGVRLYWPDGKPGTPGSRDWQENVNELSLQAGRWYPTAMIMANGSILVVGGQDGSNGKPVPSLEILPKPNGAGTIYCDWLARTDPYNLYPFLAVLPEGGILVMYYNEARILDEETFETIKTLPNIPGAVDNPKGGRTYPLEGTSVIMPQYAPYKDPLRVMVCGGSTIGNELPLDNCASIEPDATDPVWTIERMPSRRVEVCMTALPDGTFLILNGAMQGTAGFGTSSKPNLNAVLYDPNLPVNQRMKVMANTTVARLYHSEAVLLDDGRVLVSGSDPQDNIHPQEYRVEVFMPPYRLSGASIPSFTIINKDWVYGETIPFMLDTPLSGNIRVSLMGAESSTHGNSMGQRTYFPSVTCDGLKCTVVAPPNAHVCPPGWLRLFVLDGPTPSHAIWVRVGGDPAKLGNWPDYSDFDIPGVD